MDFPEVALFASHDHQIVSTVANRIVEITPEGIVDVMMDFDEYLAMKEASQIEEDDVSDEEEYIDRQAA
jgi:ATPase subunit of ABC transporter with duplicated ATPase domains